MLRVSALLLRCIARVNSAYRPADNAGRRRDVCSVCAQLPTFSLLSREKRDESGPKQTEAVRHFFSPLTALLPPSTDFVPLKSTHAQQRVGLRQSGAVAMQAVSEFTPRLKTKAEDPLELDRDTTDSALRATIGGVVVEGTNGEAWALIWR